MVFCLNPSCSKPDNPDNNKYCHGCGGLLTDSSHQYLFRSRFEVIKLLGEGGFGRTYLAKDLDCRDRFCVVKKLLIQGNEIQAKRIIELFEREGEQLDKLLHPQIPRLYAYFAHENGLYLVQEYIEGDNLHREYEQQGRFNQEKVLFLLSSLLPVLAYIHSQKILHRDIKPENIMRRRDGSLILIDFGATKELSETLPTQSTLIPSTPGYTPIEQMQGNSKEASDIYSLGATAIRLLTGCFPGNSDILYNQEHHQWRWREYLEANNIKINPQLEIILDKMIAIYLANRYQCVAEIISDLENLNLQHFTQNKTQQILINTNLQHPKDNNLKIKLLISLFGLGLLGIIGFWLFKPSQDNQPEIISRFADKINTFEDKEIVVIINEDINNPNNYQYEIYDQKTQEYVKVETSQCITKELNQELECIWQHQGMKYQVFYNPNNPSQIRLLILDSQQNYQKERILTESNKKPLW